jgi:hypothetical protein
MLSHCYICIWPNPSESLFIYKIQRDFLVFKESLSLLSYLVGFGLCTFTPVFLQPKMFKIIECINLRKNIRFVFLASNCSYVKCIFFSSLCLPFWCAYWGLFCTYKIYLSGRDLNSLCSGGVYPIIIIFFLTFNFLTLTSSSFWVISIPECYLLEPLLDTSYYYNLWFPSALFLS